MIRSEIVKLIFHISFLFILLSNIGFCANVQNSKQIENEKKEAEEFCQKIEANKYVIYAMLIKEDLSAYKRLDNAKSELGELEAYVKKYEYQKNSNNYIYSLKAYELNKNMAYDIEHKSVRHIQPQKFQKIIIPNNVYDTLDKQVIRNVALVNIFVQKIYYPDSN